MEFDTDNTEIIRLVSNANKQSYPDNNAVRFINELSPPLDGVRSITLTEVTIPLSEKIIIAPDYDKRYTLKRLCTKINKLPPRKVSEIVTKGYYVDVYKNDKGVLLNNSYIRKLRLVLITGSSLICLNSGEETAGTLEDLMKQINIDLKHPTPYSPIQVFYDDPNYLYDQKFFMVSGEAIQYDWGFKPWMVRNNGLNDFLCDNSKIGHLPQNGEPLGVFDGTNYVINMDKIFNQEDKEAIDNWFEKLLTYFNGFSSKIGYYNRYVNYNGFGFYPDDGSVLPYCSNDSIEVIIKEWENFPLINKWDLANQEGFIYWVLTSNNIEPFGHTYETFPEGNNYDFRFNTQSYITFDTIFNYPGFKYIWSNMIKTRKETLNILIEKIILDDLDEFWAPDGYHINEPKDHMRPTPEEFQKAFFDPTNHTYFPWIVPQCGKLCISECKNLGLKNEEGKYVLNFQLIFLRIKAEYENWKANLNYLWDDKSNCIFDELAFYTTCGADGYIVEPGWLYRNFTEAGYTLVKLDRKQEKIDDNVAIKKQEEDNVAIYIHDISQKQFTELFYFPNNKLYLTLEVNHVLDILNNTFQYNFCKPIFWVFNSDDLKQYLSEKYKAEYEPVSPPEAKLRKTNPLTYALDISVPNISNKNVIANLFNGDNNDVIFSNGWIRLKNFSQTQLNFTKIEGNKAFFTCDEFLKINMDITIQDVINEDVFFQKSTTNNPFDNNFFLVCSKEVYGIPLANQSRTDILAIIPISDYNVKENRLIHQVPESCLCKLNTLNSYVNYFSIEIKNLAFQEHPFVKKDNTTILSCLIQYGRKSDDFYESYRRQQIPYKHSK